MKHILLMIMVVALVGCGGSKEKNKETSKAKVVAEAKEESAKVIEVVIRKKLNKPTGELTKADYEKVTELFPVFKNLTDVKGLEKLTNLTQLELNGNKLTDVKGLEKLTQLKMLRLQDNPDLTKAQIAELQKALPKCKIDSNPKK